MRKVLILLATLLALLLCSCASAETYVLNEIHATIDIPSEYVVLTQNNLADYDQWLRARGSSSEDSLADFRSRGVLIQAWDDDNARCLEVRAVETQRSQMIFDVNEQTEAVRRDFRTSHYPGNEFEHYEFASSEWKNNGAMGRFLILKYNYRDGSEILHRGLMRRTIRNGYQIDIDLRVSGRKTSDADNTKLNKIWNTFVFNEVLPLPAKAAAKISFSKEPPKETNQKNFKIEGTAEPGVKFIAVVMRLNDPEPVVKEVVVGSNRTFSLPVDLPRDGVYVITLTAEYHENEVLEMIYPVTYQSTLLAVNFTSEPGAVSTQDQVKFAGTAEPGASLQVLVNGESVVSTKVNGEGKFAVNVEAAEEGPYDVALIFSKKGLADRRFMYNFTRKWTDGDMMAYLQKQSISPTYAQLVKGMETYEGRIMAFRSYILDVSPSGDEFIIRMAMNRKNGQYSNIFLVTSQDEPNFGVGERVMMYGTCEGMSLSTGTVEDTVEEDSYPCFALLLFATLE